tara:strand:- start:128 stop:433 length:306 start_codon:yes stop_codon:yes gene_type:complete
MALELDWTDSNTGATYTDAYAVISNLTHSKGSNNVHTFVASVKIYKDSAARSTGKAPVAKITYQIQRTYASNDTGATHRNIINEVYNDMKDNDPWDDATDV